MTKERSERPEFEGTPANAAAEGSQNPGGPQAPAGSQAAEGSAGQVDDLAGLSVEDLQTKVKQTREDAQRNWQHFLHSAADLENYKKQAARERQDAVERTRRQMLTLVLGVIDNLERALAYDDGQPAPGRGSAKALLDGLRMAHRQILDQLAAVGVRPIETLGKPFDPRLHEAIGVVQAHDDRQAAGTVAGEALKGYLLNDDVLRPAKVTVVTERPREQPADGSTDGV